MSDKQIWWWRSSPSSTNQRMIIISIFHQAKYEHLHLSPSKGWWPSPSWPGSEGDVRVSHKFDGHTAVFCVFLCVFVDFYVFFVYLSLSKTPPPAVFVNFNGLVWCFPILSFLGLTRAITSCSGTKYLKHSCKVWVVLPPPILQAHFLILCGQHVQPALENGFRPSECGATSKFFVKRRTLDHSREKVQLWRHSEGPL